MSRGRVFGLAITLVASSGAQGESLMPKFQMCLAIQDGTKERLECFDRIVPPQPRKVTKVPISILECRFPKEEDERLRCYNRFVKAPFQPNRNNTSAAR